MNRTRGTGGTLEPEADDTPPSYQLHTDQTTATMKDGIDDESVPLSPPRENVRNPDIFRDESGDNNDDDADSYEEREMTLQELMYSVSSFYAIVVPGE